MTSNENPAADGGAAAPGGDDDYAGDSELVAAADTADVVGDSGDAADACHVAAAGGVAPVASELVADDATDAADVVGSVAGVAAAGGELVADAGGVARVASELVTERKAKGWFSAYYWKPVANADVADNQRAYFFDGARLVVEYRSAAAAEAENEQAITGVMFGNWYPDLRDWHWPDNGDTTIPNFLKRASGDGEFEFSYGLPKIKPRRTDRPRIGDFPADYTPAEWWLGFAKDSASSRKNSRSRVNINVDVRLLPHDAAANSAPAEWWLG